MEGMPAWLQIEHGSCKHSCLPALLNSPIKIKKATYRNNPIIQNSLKVWSQILAVLKAPPIYLDTPICYNHGFIPGLDDWWFESSSSWGKNLARLE